jgi:hypothetical protein
MPERINDLLGPTGLNLDDIVARDRGNQFARPIWRQQLQRVKEAHRCDAE